MVQQNPLDMGEMEDIINAIPGGVAIYKVENQHFIPTFFSDGVMTLSGHSREEYEEMTRQDAMDIIYEPDRGRVLKAAQAALISGNVMDVSYRMRHKDGNLIWIHLNGRRMDSLSGSVRFYAVFTGMSAETRLFQTIVSEAADVIYIIGKENYDLLYINTPESMEDGNQGCVGQKCYMALYGKNEPCKFCTLRTHAADGIEHIMEVAEVGKVYSTRFRETDWNGIPSYVKYVRDITEEVKTRKEKERLEEYFQTVVKNLPGGVVVMRYRKDGSITPEFISDGFIEMSGMTKERTWELYRDDAMAGVHPEDIEALTAQINDYIISGENKSEMIYRLRKGEDGYVWVKNTFSLIQDEGEESRFYAIYHDITIEHEEQEKIRAQYKELILQHYRSPDPNALIIGHCNITQNRILEIIDQTDSKLLETFGTVREDFFTGLSSLVVDEEEREAFLKKFLNAPSLAAFYRNDKEQTLKCFVQLPKEKLGRYVQFTVNLVETPDTGDITGILTVTGITEQMISERIMHQLSTTSYDFVIDLNLDLNTYTMLTCKKNIDCMPCLRGSHTKRVEHMLQTAVVPKYKEQYAKSLEPGRIRRRLEREGAYTFTFSVITEKGDIRTKNITVSPVDLRLGRVCLVRTDITDSVLEQQGMLNMLAYTFELAGFIDAGSRSLTLYTRKSILENLPPFIMEDYDNAVTRFAKEYGAEEEHIEAEKQLNLDTMIKRLSERPGGYDFVFPYYGNGELRYKQINVLWGDENHKTVCVVRADVTDMLAAERAAKAALEKALLLAEEANRAKSEFLSSMSHDIRTPMNAIMGMTALAFAHIDDRERVNDCLQKISISSKHLLSLINDVLDMSKIESSQITLGSMRITLSDLLGQLSAILSPQARNSGIQLEIQSDGIIHEYFYGDFLRINQILINILSNAIKFTSEGGRVELLVQEFPSTEDEKLVHYRFTVSDTGVGMSKDFMEHIFEPFARSHGSERIEGTGLGLSITKGLIDLMGGEISVESQLNKGTTFRVELECEYANESDELWFESRKAPFSSKETEKMLVGRLFLIAEDNAINAEILTELLKMHGANSIVVTDGKSAVKAFSAAAKGTYDAVLMDIQMPEMNGYEATRAIREMEREDAEIIPIIAMTANAFAEDVQASLEAGMTAHIAKPIDVEILLNTFSKILV